MKQNPITLLLILWCTLTFITCADQKPPPKQPAAFFPKATGFVTKQPELTPDKAAVIEAQLGAKLRPSDLNPTFHIALRGEKKAMGAVLFLDVEGPSGIIEGGVGLNMQGKVVKVEIYQHQESASITEPEFLKQFIGKGIEDKFQVAQTDDAFQAVARLPKKALLLTHTLYAKAPEPTTEPTVSEPVAELVPTTSREIDTSTVEILEPEGLLELMDSMKEEYNIVREYFQNSGDKNEAVSASKRLIKYIDFILDFEPPKNPNETEEYEYFQQQLGEKMRRFVATFETEGQSENAQTQWAEIVDLANKAHLRFSVEEVDLDEDLK